MRPSRPLHRLLALTALALPTGLLSSCDQSDPTPGAFNGDLQPVRGEVDYFERFTSLAVSPQGESGITPAELERQALALITGAEQRLDCAFSSLGSPAIAQALIDARARGIEVNVAADEDNRADAGFAHLLDAGVHITFGDGPLNWAPQPGLDVERTGDTNLMTHNVIVADGLRLLGVTGGFNGPEDNLWQLGFAASSEKLGKDFRHTLKQLHAGTFATTLTVFGASTSSDGNFRTVYPTESGLVEAWFGPSEPITKRLIDEVYRAKASVWFVGEALINDALVDALRYKLESGFQVRILLSPGAEWPYDSTHPLWAVTRPAPPFTGTALVLDAQPSPIDGQRWPGHALFSTQPTGARSAFTTEEIRPDIHGGVISDLFTDGHLIGLLAEPLLDKNPNFDRTVAWFLALMEEGPTP